MNANSGSIGISVKLALRLWTFLIPFTAGRAQSERPDAVPLLPAPWTSGEELRFEIKFPTGFKVGAAFYSVEAGESGGRRIWRTSSRTFAGVHSFSRVEVDA